MAIKQPNRSLWGRYVLAPMAAVFAKALRKTQITGNQISVFSIFLTVFCTTLLSFGHTLTAGILLQVNQILDGMDGRLARLKRQASLRGKYLEIIWHECAFPLVFFGLGIHAYKMFNNPVYLTLGSLTYIYILIINLLFHRHRMIFGIKQVTLHDYLDGKMVYTIPQDIIILFTAPPYVFLYILVLSIFGLVHYLVLPYFIIYTLLFLFKFITFIFFKSKI